MLEEKDLKNASVLRSRTDLHHVVPNATRWSAKSLMLNRCFRIRDNLLAARQQDNATILIDFSAVPDNNNEIPWNARKDQGREKIAAAQ